jgi:hypothetical protein
MINPLLVETYVLNIWVCVGLAIFFPLSIFYVSYKKANAFYEIDHHYSANQQTINREKRLYLFLRRIAPSKYKSLVNTQYKEFFRKRENFPKLLYIGAFTALLGVFVLLSLDKPLLELESYWIIPPYIARIFYFEYLIVIVIAWIGGLIFGVFIGIYVLMGSKDLIFLYKKSVRGTKVLIYSFLYAMLYLIIFLDIGLTIFFGIVFPLDLFTALTFFILYLADSLIVLIQAIGFQCFRPLFSERGKNVYFNIYFIMLLQVISLLLSIFLIMPLIPFTYDHSLGLIYVLLINLGISLSIAVLFIYLGIKRLEKIE